jgi:hypothetical protein
MSWIRLQRALQNGENQREAKKFKAFSRISKAMHKMSSIGLHGKSLARLVLIGAGLGIVGGLETMQPFEIIDR